jgi:hypothetical protein
MDKAPAPNTRDPGDVWVAAAALAPIADNMLVVTQNRLFFARKVARHLSCGEEMLARYVNEVRNNLGQMIALSPVAVNFSEDSLVDREDWIRFAKEMLDAVEALESTDDDVVARLAAMKIVAGWI